MNFSLYSLIVCIILYCNYLQCYLLTILSINLSTNLSANLLTKFFEQSPVQSIIQLTSMTVSLLKAILTLGQPVHVALSCSISLYTSVVQTGQNVRTLVVKGLMIQMMNSQKLSKQPEVDP